MKIIDLDSWDRREHYLFFRGSACAHYHIGAELDVTNFKQRTADQDLAFSFAMTYAVTAVMQEVEAFCYRIQEGRVVLHETLHPYFSYLAPGKKYFQMVLGEMGPDIRQFVERTREKAIAQERYFIGEDVQGRGDLLFISSIPGVSFTHLSHTVPGNPEDAVPRLSWGRYFERDGQLILPFNLQAHHSFVDGDHMGTYFQALQQYLDDYGREWFDLMEGRR